MPDVTFSTVPLRARRLSPLAMVTTVASSCTVTLSTPAPVRMRSTIDPSPERARRTLGVPLSLMLPSLVRASTRPFTSSICRLPSEVSASSSPDVSVARIEPSLVRMSARPSTRSTITLPSLVRIVRLVWRGTLATSLADGE